jgi:hypothetical protein
MRQVLFLPSCALELQKLRLVQLINPIETNLLSLGFFLNSYQQEMKA